jgi:hypothetical protein
LKHYEAVFEVVIEAQNADEAENLSMKIREQIQSAWQGSGPKPVARVYDVVCTYLEGDFEDEDDDDDDDEPTEDDDNVGNC